METKIKDRGTLQNFLCKAKVCFEFSASTNNFFPDTIFCNLICFLMSDI